MEKLAQDINSLRSMEGTHDFNLRVKINKGENAEAFEGIPVHKFVLLARSPVLSAMLRSNMMEAKHKVMKIDDSTPEAIETLVAFMYCGEAEFGSIEHAIDVCTAADKYELIDLVELCEEYLILKLEEGVGVKNLEFRAVFDVAELCDLQGLENACVKFLVKWKTWMATHWNYPYFLSLSQCQKVLLYDTPANEARVRGFTRLDF